MEVIYHPLVNRDVTEALKDYTKISTDLADDLQVEINSVIAKAGENPYRFHEVDRGFRRANLPRFPYHVLYEVHAGFLRIMLVRHNKRHPDYGMKRR